MSISVCGIKNNPEMTKVIPDTSDTFAMDQNEEKNMMDVQSKWFP